MPNTIRDSIEFIRRLTEEMDDFARLEKEIQEDYEESKEELGRISKEFLEREALKEAVDSKSMKELERAYIEAALWSSADGKNESLEGFEMDEESKEKILKPLHEFVDVFEEEINEYMEETGDSYADVGHNFWLSTNGHGAGFFDKEAGVILDKKVSSRWKGFDLYVGDDDKVYV